MSNLCFKVRKKITSISVALQLHILANRQCSNTIAPVFRCPCLQICCVCLEALKALFISFKNVFYTSKNVVTLICFFFDETLRLIKYQYLGQL